MYIYTNTHARTHAHTHKHTNTHTHTLSLCLSHAQDTEHIVNHVPPCGMRPSQKRPRKRPIKEQKRPTDSGIPNAGCSAELGLGSFTPYSSICLPHRPFQLHPRLHFRRRSKYSFLFSSSAPAPFPAPPLPDLTPRALLSSWQAEWIIHAALGRILRR